MAFTDYSSSGSPATSGGGSADDEEGYSVATLRKQYNDFVSSKTDEIEEQRNARHYYHGDQLTTGQLTTLQKRGQPPTIRNKIDRKINGIVGLLERQRQDPKAFPRTPKHEDGAEIATSAIRYTCDTQNWRAISAEEARDGSVNGIFGDELSLIRGDKGDPDIGLKAIDNDTFFYDPRSFAYDFSDARFMGVAKWLDLDVAKEMFPDEADALDGLMSRDGGAFSIQQRDRELKWVDTNTRRIFLVEHWHIVDGEWRFCFYSGDTKLKEGLSPFTDEKDKTFPRYVVASANVDYDGDRYGFVRNLKPLQDELNAQASKRLHLLNTRRIIMEQGAVDNVDVLRREAVRADGVIVRNPGKELEFDDQKLQADIVGQTEGMQEVKAEIDNYGPNLSLIGQGLEDMSGRAIERIQQASVSELGPFILAFRDWKIRTYRAIWNTQRKYWTAERWIRVTDNEGAAKFIGVNVLQMDPQTGQPVMVSVDAQGQVLAQGSIDSLDVDIMIDEGPDTMNIMQETNETIKVMAQSGIQFPPEVFIETSDLPASEKKHLIELMEKKGQPSQFDQAVMKAKLDEVTSGTDKTKAETAKILTEVPGGAAAMASSASSASGGYAGGLSPPPQAAMGGPTPEMGATPMAPPGPPIDPETEAKVKVADAQATKHRASAYKDIADATKTIQEARGLNATVTTQEEIAQFQTALAQSALDQVKAIQQQGEMMSHAIVELARVMSAPKRIVTDAAGHPVGVETVAG